MRRIKRHQRCPYCGSLDTKRHGVKILRCQRPNRTHMRHQRWYCKQCSRTFTLPYNSYLPQLDQRAIELYFDTGTSYRAVGRTLQMRPMTAYNRIIRMGFNSKSPLEVSLELKPQWSGYLIVDGDSILIGKHKESFLLGVDAYSQDIPHAILAEHEDGMNWMYFFLVLKDSIRYPLKGIISDGDPAIQEAREAVFPEVPWQLCVRHFEKEIDRFLRYRFTQKRGYWREIDRFLRVVHEMLYAESFGEAQKYLLAISIDPGFKQAGLLAVIEKIKKKFPNLVTYYFHPGMPRTSNIAEGVISRLDAKINQADGYKCHHTCWATLKMLITRYRFKKFTDCRKKNRHKNGKSPLQLAKVDTQNIKWIRFSQRSH